MEGYNCKRLLLKSKIYVALIIISLIWEAYFLQGRAAQSVSEGNGNALEAELSEVFSDEKDIAVLQIPEKLEIIIDPWEIDGKRQIYSMPFTVSNKGEGQGVLTLSFTLKANDEGGVTIEKAEEGIHDSERKSAYLKLVLGNGEEIVFTEESVQCQAELQPGESLSLWFEGKVNENAEDSWKDGDIEVEGIYFWATEKVEPNKAEEAVPFDESVKKEKNEEISSAEPDGKASEEEKIPPFGPNEKDGSEEVPPAESEGEEPGEENASPVESDEQNSGEASPPAESDGGTSEEGNVPSIEPDEQGGNETIYSPEPETEPSKDESVPPIEPDKQGGSEVTPSDESEREALEEENGSSSELYEEDDSEEVSLVEPEGKDVDRSRLTENMSEE